MLIRNTKNALLSATFIALSFGSPAAAQALSSDCVVLQGASFALQTGIGIGAELIAGETVTVTLSSPSDVVVSLTVFGPSFQTTSGTVHRFTVPTSGVYWWSADPGAPSVSWDCTNVPPVPEIENNDAADLASATAGIAATQQHNMMASATSRVAQDRLVQRSVNGLTARGVFLSTQNLGQSALDRPEFNVWASTGFTRFSGDSTGHAADILLGADRLFGDNMLAGVMVAFGNTEIEQDGITSRVKSPAIGAYFANRFANNLLLDGYLGYAAPEITADGGQVTGENLSGSLSLTGSMDVQAGTLRPFVQIGGYDLSIPAYSNDSGAVEAETQTRLDAHIGARFDSGVTLGDTDLTPYFSLAAGYGVTESTLSGREEYRAPQIGFGVSGALGGGYLNLGLDGSQIGTDTYAVSMNLSWEMTF